MIVYFIRFTETIEADIKRNTSILTNRDNMIIEGLCAFPGGDTEEQAVIKARRLARIVANENDIFCIIKGRETFGPSGSLGTVVTNVELVSTHTV